MGLGLILHGLELSRGFRALKAWFSLKNHGVEGWTRAIENNLFQAQHLAARIESEPKLELVRPVTMNIVCFRFRPREEKNGDSLNKEIMLLLQERGIAVVSGTLIAGKFAMRAAITNHRTKEQDLHLLVDAVLQIGSQIVANGT